MDGRLEMEIRSVDVPDRMLVGVVAPYDEVSYIVPVPGGERIMRGAFEKSIRQRGDRIPLLYNHATDFKLGVSTSFEDGDEGLVGTFRINEGARGDSFLEELRQGYFGGMSAGFVPLVATRGTDGVKELREAKLVEVSTVGLPAYEGAGLIAVRSGQDLAELLAPFQVRPDVNLEPIPSIWGVR